MGLGVLPLSGNGDFAPEVLAGGDHVGLGIVPAEAKLLGIS